MSHVMLIPLTDEEVIIPVMKTNEIVGRFHSVVKLDKKTRVVDVTCTYNKGCECDKITDEHWITGGDPGGERYRSRSSNSTHDNTTHFSE